MKPTEPYELQIVKWSNENPDEELCGVLLQHGGSFRALQLKNVATDRRNSFAMDEKPFLEAVKSGQVWGTWHVHPNQWDDDGPSLADLDRSNAWNMPGCVYVRRSVMFHYWTPDGYKAPIFGRPYVPDIFDCARLVSDALREYCQYDMPLFDRDFFHAHGHMGDHERWWAPYGVEMVLQPKPGRVALIDFRGGGRVNHMGLVVSNRELLHHLRGQVSELAYLGNWVRYTHSYLMHPDIEALVEAKGWRERLPIDPFTLPGTRVQRVLDRSKVTTADLNLKRPQRRLPLRHPLREFNPFRVKRP